MAQATGIFKQVSLKREVTYGLVPAAAGAQLMRRVTSTVDLSKDTYASNEIRPDFQIADYRHGVRRVKGTLSGELSPKTYSDPISAMLKRDFTAGVAAAALAITIGGLAGAWTVTRGTGSYLTDGFKIGDVIRLSVGGFTAANLSKNLMITALTATIATCIVLNASLLVVEGPISGSTVTVFGKKTFIPTTGQTDISYSLEHYFSDIVQSEVFSGVKFDKGAINLPPTGMATIALDVIGQDLAQRATSRYFTSPTSITTTGVVAAVNGILIVGGVAQTVVTGLSINIDPMFSGDPVVGANTVPNQFAGPVNVTGQFTAYFTDATLRDLFVNETESSLMVVLTTDNTATADFISFVLSRIKVGGQQKNDGTGGIVQTFPFQALINVANGGAGFANEATTITCQDSQA